MIKNSARLLVVALVSVISFSTLQTPLSAESGIYDRIGIFPEHGNQGIGEESINYFNGNLTLKFLDIHLPGANGFDLNIWRIYNSKLAEDSTGWNLAQFNQEPVGWVGLGWSLHMAGFSSIMLHNSILSSSRMAAVKSPTSRKMEPTM